MAADFNGDQGPDILTQHDGGFALLVSNGDGTFQPPVSRAQLGPGEFIQGFVVGDFNGDNRPDLIGSTLAQALLFAGLGDGTFQDPVVLAAVPPGDTVLAVADLDGDPHPDLVRRP